MLNYFIADYRSQYSKVKHLTDNILSSPLSLTESFNTLPTMKMGKQRGTSATAAIAMAISEGLAGQKVHLK